MFTHQQKSQSPIFNNLSIVRQNIIILLKSCFCFFRTNKVPKNNFHETLHTNLLYSDEYTDTDTDIDIDTYTYTDTDMSCVSHISKTQMRISDFCKHQHQQQYQQQYQHHHVIHVV
jgi:hypothetical protein